MSASLEPCTRPSPVPWALVCCGVRTRQPVHCARPRCRSSEVAIGRRRLARQRGPGVSGAHDPARRQPGGHRRAAARHPTPRRLGEGRADPGRGDGQEQGRRIVNGADAAAQGAAGARRASAIVVAVLCLLWVARTADAVGSGGRGQVLFVAAMFVLPLAYVVPATRAWWTARRWWLLAAQAGLTCVPFAVFGSRLGAGGSGPLAGPVVLPCPVGPGRRCRCWTAAGRGPGR